MRREESEEEEEEGEGEEEEVCRVGPINRGRVGTNLWTIGSDPSQSEA